MACAGFWALCSGALLAGADEVQRRPVVFVAPIGICAIKDPRLDIRRGGVTVDVEQRYQNHDTSLFDLVGLVQVVQVEVFRLDRKIPYESTLGPGGPGGPGESLTSFRESEMHGRASVERVYMRYVEK